MKRLILVALVSLMGAQAHGALLSQVRNGIPDDPSLLAGNLAEMSSVFDATSFSIVTFDFTVVDSLPLSRIKVVGGSDDWSNAAFQFRVWDTFANAEANPLFGSVGDKALTLTDLTQATPDGWPGFGGAFGYDLLTLSLDPWALSPGSYVGSVQRVDGGVLMLACDSPVGSGPARYGDQPGFLIPVTDDVAQGTWSTGSAAVSIEATAVPEPSSLVSMLGLLTMAAGWFGLKRLRAA